MNINHSDLFSLKNKNIVITGGAGLLGQIHAEAVLEFGGLPLLIDIDRNRLQSISEALSSQFDRQVPFYTVDITKAEQVDEFVLKAVAAHQQIDVLINNAARNPKMEGSTVAWSRLENFSEEHWDLDLNVGLKGAFICSQKIGTQMAKSGGGCIINIASDLGLIGPDQRLYRQDGLPPEKQPVKPVTYSVVKSGLIGLTRYLATYWADAGIRVNCLCPGGVYNDQPMNFVHKLSQLIPLNRMAKPDEYKGSIVYLASQASSYMTGSIMVVDGGRTAW